MKTERAIGRSARHRSRLASMPVRLGIFAFLGFVLWSVSGSAAADVRGAHTCRVLTKAATIEYLVGEACPPEGFAETMGYEPIIVATPYGWRYEKPAWAGGNCSVPVGDRGLFWSFGSPCRTHDYGYDLVRFGVGNRPQADDLFYRDMVATCGDNAPFGELACRASAKWVHLALQVGDATGFDPEVLPHA
ncbi:MAG: phospholipase A2 [Actinomycetota bacterium]